MTSTYVKTNSLDEMIKKNPKEQEISSQELN